MDIQSLRVDAPPKEEAFFLADTFREEQPAPDSYRRKAPAAATARWR